MDNRHSNYKPPTTIEEQARREGFTDFLTEAADLPASERLRLIAARNRDDARQRFWERLRHDYRDQMV